MLVSQTESAKKHVGSWIFRSQAILHPNRWIFVKRQLKGTGYYIME